MWKSSDDSLKITGFARIMDDLLSKALPGKRVPSIKVPGTLYTSGRARNVKVKLDRLKGDSNIIIFYTEGCEVCKEQRKSALAMLGDKKIDMVMMVNVDQIMASDPKLASVLMDSFDLSSLPYVMMTDASGTVIRRYMAL